MAIAKKVVGTSADKNVIESDAERIPSGRLRAMLRTPWAWPRAVLVIALLSLLLWGGTAAIALLAFH